MRVLKSLAIGLIVSLTVAALPAAAGDLTVVAKVTTKGVAATSTTYMSTDKFKTASPDQDTIVDLKGGRYVFVDHKKKEYWETTSAEFEAAMKQLEAQMNEMAEKMKNLPPAVRDKLAPGGGGPIPAVSVQKGTGTKVVAGHTCEPYTVSMGDAMKIEMWVAADVEIPPQHFEARKVMSQGPALQRFAKAFDEMKKIKGYPLLEVTSMKVMGQSMDSTREVTEIRKDPIPASTFEVPAGYKKKDSPFKAR